MGFYDDIQGALTDLNATIALPDGTRPFFLWRGATVPCVPNMLEVGNTIVEGGKEETIVAVLYVNSSEFLTIDSTLITIDSTLYTTDNDTPTPVTGKLLTFRGKQRRILTAALDGSGAFFKLVLGSARK